MPEPILIRPDEPFDHLRHPPITEAVVEFRAKALVPLEEQAVSQKLAERLPEYPSRDSRREFRVAFSTGEMSRSQLEDAGWAGLRLRSSDGRQIAQFGRDRFSFSRLAPYENWESFRAEALRLWDVHVDLTRPTEIERLGLRYINLLPVPKDGDFEDYFSAPIDGPRGLDLLFAGFVHRDTLVVPGHPYTINIVRTVQPPTKNTPAQASLILDIDVSTPAVAVDRDTVGSRLAQMRWLKNKAFFGSFTEKALGPLR